MHDAAGENTCRAIAMACLQAICSKEEAKDADRIAAAKLLLEQGGGGEGKELRVVMEAVPEEYLT